MAETRKSVSRHDGDDSRIADVEQCDGEKNPLKDRHVKRVSGDESKSQAEQALLGQRPYALAPLKQDGPIVGADTLEGSAEPIAPAVGTRPERESEPFPSVHPHPSYS
jgi:hypothetical protein